MKDFLQRILEWKLIFLAKAYLRRYKPMIIAVTGNAGKTSTKEAIAVVLRCIKTVRSNTGNLNHFLGVPLTIIGDFGEQYYQEGSSVGFWFIVLLKGFFGLFIKQAYPEVLLMEYGMHHPGDLKQLASLFPPAFTVVTTVGDVPVHVEYFKNAEAVADDKAQLVRALAPTGYAILNHDDPRVLAMREKTKAHVMTYGFAEDANIKISNFEFVSDEEGRPMGEIFKLHNGPSFVPVTINGSLGRSQAWSAAAAAAVGIVFDMNLVQISEALAEYHGPKGRLRIIAGIKQSNIIDDTYNASPASTRLALETLRDLPGLRKVAVLGDMLELGEYSEKSHHDIGTFAGSIANMLVCVGTNASLTASAARAYLSPQDIHVFKNSDEAAAAIGELIKERDLILVKGSQGARMEKIVAALMFDKENKKELLVRQSDAWLKR